MKTTINSTDLELIHCASKDTARYNLNYVRITPAFSEATDSRVLCRVERPGAINTPGQETFLSRENVKTLQPMARRGADIVVQNENNVEGDHSRDVETLFTAADNSATIKTDGMGYPETWRVMPDDTPSGAEYLTLGIDLDALVSLARVFKKAGETKVRLTFKLEDENNRGTKTSLEKVHVDGTGDASHVRGVVMPCRID